MRWCSAAALVCLPAADVYDIDASQDHLVRDSRVDDLLSQAGVATYTLFCVPRRLLAAQRV